MSWHPNMISVGSPNVPPRIAAEATVGAVENFNYWAARGSSLLDLVLPEDLAGAAVLVPTIPE